jgi:CBS-domain-containing membrane protein
MKARDVMGTHVITVGPDQDVRTAAKLLTKHHISAAPVVDPQSGKLLGIISEGDLIRRAETGTSRTHSWFLDLFTAPQKMADDFVKSHARKVRDVMTHDVVTASPDTPLREIATLLEKHGIKRVPIVSNGRLAGIVSRANLVQALASRSRGVVGIEKTDQELREAVAENLAKQPGSTALVNVIAESGVVNLWGFAENEKERKAIRVAAEVTPGVRAVNDNLQIRHFALAI